RVAVHPPAVAAEEEPAEPEREDEQPPGALGLTLPAMFPEEADVPARDLDEVPPSVGGAADVDDLRARIEEHLPARRPKAVAPVRLLAEEEEALVGRADGVDRRTPHEQAGAHQPIALAYGSVVEPAGVERVQHPGAR